MKTRSKQWGWVVCLLGVCGAAAGAGAGGPRVQVVSAPYTGAAASRSASGESSGPVLSPDGRWVTFASNAANVTTNDHPLANPGSYLDVYLRDRTTHQTRLVSVNRTGNASGQGNSVSPSISANGRWVAFESSAADLVLNDTNGFSDVFVRDLQTGVTTLVSVNAAGTGGGNGASENATITPDGRFVVFESVASDLVAGDTNGIPDVFVRDLQTGVTSWVSAGAQPTSIGSGESFGPLITDDGHVVVFTSSATNLVPGYASSLSDNRGLFSSPTDVYARNLNTGELTVVSTNAPALWSSVFTNLPWAPMRSGNPALSADGRFVAFGASAPFGSTNALILRHDLLTGTTALVSSNAMTFSAFGDDSAGPVMSADGRFVAFLGQAQPADTQVYLWDAQSGTTALASVNVDGTGSADDVCAAPALSADGSHLAFLSYADDLVTNVTAGGWSLYVRNLMTGVTTLASVDRDGEGNDDLGTTPVLSADGHLVAFDSIGSNLVADDRNNTTDVFVRDTDAGMTELTSERGSGPAEATANGSSAFGRHSVSADGRFVLFESLAGNLIAGGQAGVQALFVRDLLQATNILVSANTNGAATENGVFSASFLSANGRYVLFGSPAADLASNATNGQLNLFVRDLHVGTTSLVPVSSTVKPGCLALIQISGDGRYVFYQGCDVVYRWDALNQETRSHPLSPFPPFGISVAEDGRAVVFYDTPQGNLSTGNLSVWLPETGATQVIQAVQVVNGLNYAAYAASISGDGRVVTYLRTQNETNYFRYDVAAQTNRMVGAGSGYPVGHLTLDVDLTRSGKYIAYASRTIARPGPGNLGATDVFLLDVDHSTTTLVSLNHAGTAPGNGVSDHATVSEDGRFVVFRSTATDLIEDGYLSGSNVYLRDMHTGMTTLLDVSYAGTGSGNGFAGNPILSHDGSVAFFTSDSANLVRGDFNNQVDVFYSTVARTGIVDTDGDGMDDAWERAHFGDLSHDGTADSDGDGMTDLQEFLAGTDPLGASSSFRPEAMPPTSGGQNTVHWPAAPGRGYRVEYKSELADAAWQDLGAPIFITGNVGSVTDTASPGTARRFYRVVLQP